MVFYYVFYIDKVDIYLFFLWDSFYYYDIILILNFVRSNFKFE